MIQPTEFETTRNMPITAPKKLIEVALPLDDINAEHADGFDEQVQRTVKTNCGELTFTNYEFEG